MAASRLEISGFNALEMVRRPQGTSNMVSKLPSGVDIKRCSVVDFLDVAFP